MTDLDDLIEEAAAAAFRGWDFVWLRGRTDDPKTRGDTQSWFATHSPPRAARWTSTPVAAKRSPLARPSTGSSSQRRVTRRTSRSRARTSRRLASRLVAVESAPDNIDQQDATPADTGSHLPFHDGSFDLVLNRYYSYCPNELARVLRPGGTYLTQQRGEGDDELLRLFDRPVHVGPDFDVAVAVGQLEDAGFEILRAEEFDATVRFFDVGAVVYYLRAIPWIVPNFDVEADRHTLHRIHETIRADGWFGVGSYRFLIEARTMR